MKKILLLAAAALLTSNAMMAEDNCKNGPKLKSWNFVEVQGGMEWTATDAKIDKLFSKFALEYTREQVKLPCPDFRRLVEK